MSFLLLILSISSFLLFGVVGEDKTWLLAPAMVLNHVLVLGWWIGKARQLSAGDKHGSVGCYFSIDTICWLLFLIYGIAIIPFSTVPFESKLELLFLGSVFGAFIVWRNEVTSFKESRVYVALLFGVVLLCALYGLVIHFKSPEMVLWAERYTDHYLGRLASTYICPNHFAHLLQMLLPFLVIWVFISQVSTFLKGLAAYTFVAFLPPLFLTESRAGWLGSLTALGVLGLLFAWRRSKKLFWIMLIIVPLVGSSMLAAGYFYSETFQRRMEPVVQFIAGQAEGGIGSEARDFRPQTWADTLVMIDEEPLLGHGPGAYRYTYPEFRERFKGQRIVTGHPHNEYLELAADYGWIGFVLFAVAWLSSLGRCLIFSVRSKETRHAFVGFAAVAMGLGTMVHSFFDFQMHIYPNAMIFASLLAFAVAPMERYQKKRGFRIRHRAGLWIGVVVALVGLIFCVKVMTSAYMRAYADKTFVSARSENASSIYWAEQAIKWDSSNWQAHQSKASILYDLRYYSLNLSKKLEIAHRERSAYEKAYFYNKKSPMTCAGLGKVNFFLSRHSDDESEAKTYSKDAFMYLEKACSLRKYNDLYWWTLGSELRRIGLYSEALDIFKKAGKIKNSVSIRTNIQWLQERLNPEILSTESNNVKRDQKADATQKNDHYTIQHILQLMERWETADDV
jgi:O-antigen ligase